MSIDTFPEIRIKHINSYVFRHPLKKPVVTSFGTMRDRPAVYVRLEEENGVFGWGEIFANWPAAGAEHRARLLIEDISGLVLGKSIRSPSDAFYHLEEATHLCALQCGEWGPFRQVIAGVDSAIHDIYGRLLKVPVRCLLNKDAPDSVPVYASGIHIRDALTVIPECRSRGFSKFKLKVGFDLHQDVKDVFACLDTLLPDEMLFLDANQAWSVDEALKFTAELDGSGIGWFEEPIAADAPLSDWQRLREGTSIPLAGGENLAGSKEFDLAFANDQFDFYQPDIAKWGGFTGCYQIGRSALQAGKVYCPHFLGGAVGLHASAQLLAAVGGPGLLEVDVNPNPLRDVADEQTVNIQNGEWTLPDEPGLALDNPSLLLKKKMTLELSVS